MRLLLCDDHRLVAESLALVLEAAGHEVVAVVEDPEQAIQVLETCDVDICVMDLKYRDGDGCRGIAELTNRHPSARVVVLSGYLDDDRTEEIRAAGVAAWAVKRGDLASIVQLVVGEIDENISVERIDRWANDPFARFLTRREREVLEGMARGESTAAVADHFGVSNATVRTHIQSVLSKLGVHSRLEAVAFAISHSLIDIEPQSQSA